MVLCVLGETEREREREREMEMVYVYMCAFVCMRGDDDDTEYICIAHGLW